MHQDSGKCTSFSLALQQYQQRYERPLIKGRSKTAARILSLKKSISNSQNPTNNEISDADN